ncbi:MAG: ChaN family lipoprotein [Bacteroidales bacterium]|jgi:uncharacterized iron-regulated protein
MRKLFVLALTLITLASFTPDKPAYLLFNGDGTRVNYVNMLESLQDADVVFFGEQHDNPISHWLELEITKDLYVRKSGNMMIGAEMFEADNQLLLNEYLKGQISESSFEKEARLWPNYKTDYKPLVKLAKDSSIYFVATNVPRRYASLVYKQGLDTLEYLSAEAKSYMAPLPIAYDSTVACYADIMKEMNDMGHNNPNLPKSQALKDATMAYQIALNLTKGTLFIHYNGSYHSDKKESIIWHLNQYKPGLKVATISTVVQSDIDTLVVDNQHLADFIIVVPEDMTKTN